MTSDPEEIVGVVEHGFKRGATLGFPTANVSFFGNTPPTYGVYAATFEVLNGPHIGFYKACVSIGVRPTFLGEEPNLEAHLLDFSGDLYGSRVIVELKKRIRDERKFGSVDELVLQIKRDVEAARAHFADFET